MLRPTRRRRATTAVECAFVFPFTFLMIFGLLIGGMGVFRYQEVANLAREGARYAIVHGIKYQGATGKAAATPTTIYNNAILPKVVSLDTSQLTYTVSWNTDNRPGSTVTVRVNYHWIPEALLGGMDLTSTSTMTMCY
jgi:Flp pilus assembly protein TadG